jgi:ABC-type uncharacterized transport system permease subunit
VKILPLFFIAAALMSEEAPTIAANASPDKSVMMIDPKIRANDYVQAFDMLRKDKPTMKMMIRTSSAILQNVTDLSIAPGGTLIYVRALSNQGTKIQIVRVEELQEINYSP